jgi:Tfp pilus assembly protein PilN
VKPIAINLASRPFYNVTLYAVAFSAGLALLVGMTGFNAYTFIADRLAMRQLNAARERLQTDLDDLDRGEARLRADVSRISLPKVGQESAFARDAIVQRSLSWTALFNRLEEVQPPDVRVRSIRPSIDAQKVRIRVVGVAQSYEAFTEFEEALLGSPWFSEVYPSSESWNAEQRGIGFDLSFAYHADAERAGGKDAGAAAPGGPTR